MRSWIATAAALVFAAIIVPLARNRAAGAQAGGAATAPAPLHTPASAEPPPPVASTGESAARAAAPSLEPPRVDLARLEIRGDEAIAPTQDGKVAHLTLDPGLQRAAERILRGYEIPEAAVVALETSTNRVLAWASHVEKGPKRDLCAEASAPAASVFKIVTGAALVETAGLGPDARQCYGGGESRITQLDLVDNPRRDRWCATLADAMGRSINTVFARLALKDLKPADLEAAAGALGFGAPIPFDVPVEPSRIHLPDDPLGFARTAAGFWNTTLSPLEGAMLASTVANQGEVLRPVLVDSVNDGARTVYRAPPRQPLRRAMRPETAAALTSMMETTVANGTSFRAFRDPEGRPFLPGISVAGKTGTLTRAETQQFYTWFVGFAPSREPEIAVAVLVVNRPKWRVKANVVARDVLRAYFAAKKCAGVTRPR